MKAYISKELCLLTADDKHLLQGSYYIINELLITPIKNIIYMYENNANNM